jgi:hypothetical protein
MVDMPKTMFNANEMLTLSNGFRNAVSTITNDVTVQKYVEFVGVDEAQLKSAMSKGLSSQFTEIIGGAEEANESAFCTFRNLAKTFSEQTDDLAVAEGATKIITVIKNVNWNLHKLGYKKQLAQQDTLEEKLNTPELLQAIETAGLTKWFNVLKATTVKLHEVADKRVDEVNENNLPLIKESKDKLFNHLLKLYNHIDIQEELDPEVYVPASRAITAILNTIIPEARGRKAQRKANTIPESVLESAS